VNADVVVVGAGLAGLACARELAAAGRDVVVLESSDAVGGRVRTDLVEGFRLDRGFQVLLTGYPALRRLDLAPLDLRPFSPGVTIRYGRRFARVADPLREPQAALAALRVLSPADGLRLLRWRQRLLGTPGADLAAAPQTTTETMLRRQGFSPRAVAGFFRPFLAGTFFDPGLTTSSRFTELVFRSFFRDDAAVPAAGMQALPELLARDVPPRAVRVGAAVSDIVTSGRGWLVRTADEEITARAVVVATAAPAAAALVGDRASIATAHRSTTTVHYAADTSPIGGPDLVLGADGGPVTTVAAMSDVAPTYAPPGATLVSVGLLGSWHGDEDAEDRAVRNHLRGWWGGQVDGWRRLRVDRIAYAQPRMDVGDVPSLRRPVTVGDGLYVCGDHRDTASIQGALVSGRRTAAAVLAD
jgi:phytoene dehydrogenase-like protein